MTAPHPSPDKPLTPQHAWQPFTPRGVAAFGSATLTRTILAQFAVAVFIGFAFIWALRAAWVPVINEAIQKLPDTGSIRQGTLHYNGESPRRLAENRHLAIVIDLAGSREAGHVADLEITLEKNRVALHGPIGAWWQNYDPRYIISCNRPELEPWWGAWRWAILAIGALALGASLFVMWWTLALVYVPLVKFIAFFTDRGVTWRGAWRLSAAALLPGACLVGLALLLYGSGAVGLLHFGLLYALHVVMGWVYVFTSPLFLPKLAVALETGNPFNTTGLAVPPNPFGDADKK